MDHKKRMNRTRLKIVSLVSAPLLVGLGVVVADSSFAGTNGQEIQFCQNGNSIWDKAEVTGKNQNGQDTTHVFNINFQGCTLGVGFFWKGLVEITWKSVERGSDNTICIVPETSSNNSFKCIPNAQ